MKDLSAYYEIARLITAELSETITPEEKERLNVWLAEDERHYMRYCRIRERLKRGEGENVFRNPERVREDMEKLKKKQKFVIKLLASNNIDINKENVERARRIYTTLNNLVDNMKPETVVKMIDDGINPMNTDIWTVNDYLSSMNQGATKDNEEKYSKFLYKLDKTGGINETKKKQFIGIYQMMNIFTRDAGFRAFLCKP